MGWTNHSGSITLWQDGVAYRPARGTTMGQVSIIGIDLAKQGFQLRGARPDGSVAFQKKLTRGKVPGFLASPPWLLHPCGG